MNIHIYIYIFFSSGKKCITNKKFKRQKIARQNVSMPNRPSAKTSAPKRPRQTVLAPKRLGPKTFRRQNFDAKMEALKLHRSYK